MTRIFIKDPYIGADSGGNRVWPGEYDLFDPLLFGVGQSLLDTGYAVEVEEPETEPDEIALEDMTKAQLEAFAKENAEFNDIDVSKAKNKDAFSNAIHTAFEAVDAWVEAATEEEEE